MSYTPNTWKSGDVVTSAKLNNIENGILNAVAMVEYTFGDQGKVLSKTWNEVAALADAGTLVMLYSASDGSYYYEPVFGIYGYGGTYSVATIALDDTANFVIYSTDSADGYPVAED